LLSATMTVSYKHSGLKGESPEPPELGHVSLYSCHIDLIME